MKRIFYLVILVVFSFLIFGIQTYASDKVTYEITYNDGVYMLHRDDKPIAESLDIGELLLGVSELCEEIVFNGVRSDDDLTLTRGKYTFCGDFSFGNIVINEGASLSLVSSQATCNSIKILGGELVLYSGQININDGSLTVDYSTGSRYTQYGGELNGSTENPLIDLKNGSAVILGGRVTNVSGVAVEVKGDMRIGGGEIRGKGFDIITHRFIWTENDGKGLTSKIKMKYEASFSRGSSTEVVKGIAADKLDLFTLSDANGCEIGLTARGSGIFVHLPFLVSFIHEGEVIEICERLKGECVIPPSIDFGAGHTLRGWYKGGESLAPFDFATGIDSDLTLYAITELDSPSYSLNGIDVQYNGSVHTLGFSSLYHPLEESGKYLFEWTDESGNVVSTKSTLGLTNVKQSGRYKCKILFTFNGEISTVETPYVTVNIRPKIIEIPKDTKTKYTGKVQYPIISGDGFVYTECGFVDVGKYEIELTLVDYENTRWRGCDERTVTTGMEILRADNGFVSELVINDTYIGAEIKYTVESLFGKPLIEYAENPDGPYLRHPPTREGVFYARAVVEGTESYFALVGNPVQFKLINDEILSFAIASYPSKSVYRSFEKFDPKGVRFSLLYASGKSEVIDASEVLFTYLSGNCFSVLHNGIIASYLDAECILPVTVVPAEYALDISFFDTSVSFDGAFHSILPIGKIAPGLDGSIPQYTVVGGGINKGSYTLELSFTTSSIEYRAPDSLFAILTIAPRSIELVWSGDSFVYDGTAKSPTAYYYDVNGRVVYPAVSGAASLAGVSYFATAVEGDLNYSFINPSKAFEILPAVLDLSGAKWTADSFVYSGAVNFVTITNLPEGVSVVGYLNNGATSVGSYIATAILSYDSNNYILNENPTKEFSVLPAEYDLTGFDFLGGEYVYDKMTHYPILSGSMPIGADGSMLSYTFSHGVSEVSDDSTVVISFYSASENYKVPAPISVSVRIKPLGIYVEWTGLTMSYNGRLQSPIPISDACRVYTSDAAINAGRYTATAICDNLNYRILNPVAEYEITPLTNAWTDALTVGIVFDGRTPLPVAAALYGSVEFYYYSDPNLTESIAPPSSVGRYYVVAVADGGENYTRLISAPLAFDILPVLPIEIVVSGRCEYTAFEKITEGDVSARLINNDGSEILLAFSDLSIEYVEGECLHVPDNYVRIGYLDISTEYAVSVKPAVYDMSGIFWTDLTSEYDGNAKYPILSGLPDGVSVKRYLGVGVSAAGEYEICAVLSYDEINFLPLGNISAKMTINKRAITPALPSVEYNGGVHSPDVSELPFYTEAASYSDAGTYTLACYLKDNENYYLTDNTVDFIILPRRVFVRVGDIDKYWFGDTSNYSIEFPHGATVTLEELSVKYEIKEGKVWAFCDNPNYELVVTEGRVIKRNRPSPRVTVAMFGILLLVMILGSGIAIIIICREDISNAYARLLRRRAVLATDGGSEYASGDLVSVDSERADKLLSDSAARAMIHREEAIMTSGTKKYVLNIETLDELFIPGERVDINVLKARGVIPEDVGYLKILAGGTLNKPLRVYANAFSLSAVKMLVLMGGEVYKVKSK